MSRCIACDAILSTIEMCKRKSDGSYEDMCRYCLSTLFQEIDDELLYEEIE